MTHALAVAVDQIIRYRTGPWSTRAGLVVSLGQGSVLIEENVRFITPQRKWIQLADIVEVLSELQPPEQTNEQT